MSRAKTGDLPVAPPVPVPSVPGWTWQGGIYRHPGGYLVVWSNGGYRWWIQRGTRIVRSGHQPTARLAMAAAEAAAE